MKMHTTPLSFAAGLAIAGAMALTLGAAAQMLSGADITRLTNGGTSPNAHQTLAAHYRAHAAEHVADAKVHRGIALEAKKHPLDDHTWELAQAASHYAEHSEEAAEALRDLAAIHEGMAEQAGPHTGALRGR